MSAGPGRERLIVVTDLNFPSDDFQALALLLSMPEFEIAQIVATDGNTWAEEVEENVTAVLKAYGRADIPVVTIPAVHRHHGRTRAYRAYRRGYKSFLGPYLKSMAPRSPHNRAVTAARALAAFASAIEIGITVVSLGPMSPIAYLLRTYPERAAAIGRIVAMAGWFDAGREDTRADFNVWFDPHAARSVFRSGLPILLLPRDACAAAKVDPQTLARLDCSTRMGRCFVADIVGMLAQHGPEFPLIDTLVPLILAHPNLIISSWRGSVHVRRKPLSFSGRTHFRADPAGSAVVIRSLNPDALRRCLLGRARVLGGGAPTCADEVDFDVFPAAVWLGQRLRDRPFVGLRLEADRDDGAALGDARPGRPEAISSALTVDSLLTFLRDASDLMTPAVEAGSLAAGAWDPLWASASLARDADLLARVVRLDALATWTEGGRLRGFAGLSVATPWRCIELNRTASPRVAAGDGLVDVTVLAPDLDEGEVAAGLRDALTDWWRRESRAAGDVPGPRLHALAFAATMAGQEA